MAGGLAIGGGGAVCARQLKRGQFQWPLMTFNSGFGPSLSSFHGLSVEDSPLHATKLLLCLRLLMWPCPDGHEGSE